MHAIAVYRCIHSYLMRGRKDPRCVYLYPNDGRTSTSFWTSYFICCILFHDMYLLVPNIPCLVGSHGMGPQHLSKQVFRPLKRGAKQGPQEVSKGVKRGQTWNHPSKGSKPGIRGSMSKKGSKKGYHSKTLFQ